jgi:hypothetical protein
MIEGFANHASSDLVITNKQMWNSERQEFLPTRLYRVNFGQRRDRYLKVTKWLTDTYGRSQQHDGSRYWGETFNVIIMSEKVYLFYLMKWDGEL